MYTHHDPSTRSADEGGKAAANNSPSGSRALRQLKAVRQLVGAEGPKPDDEDKLSKMPKMAPGAMQAGGATAQLATESGGAGPSGATTSAPENRTGIPDGLKSSMEHITGMDLSDVRVHYNSEQPAGINALAYAQGDQVHIGPGQDHHLAHEIAHVVQQREGRVQPTMQLQDNIPVNTDPGLESQADDLGAEAMRNA